MSKNIYEELSIERKALQEQGLVPKWYTTSGLQMYKEKYEYEVNGRSVRGQFERIANTAASYLKNIGMEETAKQKFFDMLWDGWLSPSTPVLANMGTKRGLPVSCSGGFVSDSIDGFYSARHETAMLTKYGFGTSAYLGAIRPRGSKISVGGKASGVLPVFKGFVQDMRDVAQGTARRGAWAGYIEIDHPDFDEIADYIVSNPDDANIGWLIKDSFIEGLDAGHSDSIRRFQKALKMKMVTGKGYFCFIDKVNRKRPKQYQINNLDVKASNLCLTGDTMIFISKTKDHNEQIPMSIKDFTELWELGYFCNAPVYVKSYNGTEIVYSEITAAACTGITDELIEIETESGKVIRCTPDHQIFTKNRGWVKAIDLEATDELVES